MKNRRFPYGYEMQCGKIHICKAESNILAEIFDSYINGSNLKEISDNLTGRKVEYLPDERCWNKSRIMHINNDIERLLEQPDFDKDKLQNLILECAEKKYSYDKSTRHITDRLKADFEKSSPLSVFSMDLFEKTVSAVLIDKRGSVSIKLKNGNIIGKENQNGCTNYAST